MLPSQSSGGELGGVYGSDTITGLEYDFFTGDGARILLRTLLWLEFFATEKADLEELDEPNDEFGVPDAGRGNIFGPPSRIDMCT